MRTPAARNPATAAPNRTGSRTCRTQNPGSAASADTSPPVTADTSAIPGTRHPTNPVTAANPASIGSINGE